MKPHRKANPVQSPNSSETFLVWTDESGHPRFPDKSTPDLPPEFFIHINPSLRPREGQYVLVSREQEMFFDRQVRKNEILTFEKQCPERDSDLSALILGVVVSGIEWFAVPEDE